MSEREWSEFFPFASVRNEQSIAIDAVLNAFGRGKKYFVLQGETGVGKSAIAMTVARVLAANAGGHDGASGCYVLTTQKILQKQYVDDFDRIGMLELKSASNYECKRSPDRSCGEVRRCLKALNDRCDRSIIDCRSDCSYLDEKRAFITSPLGVTNYSYFLSETMYARGLKPRQLLVCDEAHNVQDVLSRHIEVSFSERVNRTLGVSPPKDADMQSVVDWIATDYKRALVLHIASIVRDLADASKHGNDDRVIALSRDNERFDKHVCKVNRFLSDFHPANWIMNEIEGSLEFKPIDVSRFAHERLFQYGDRVLCMSATILDRETFCRSVGIPIDDAEFVDAPSPFPAENRPIHFLPVGSMSRKSIDENLPKLVEMVKVLLHQHRKEKGIIHCQTYRIANFIRANIRSKRLLIHSANDRDEVLEQHKASTVPTVLLSPSMGEGVDLAGDHSRFQIICKVPYPSLSDAVVVKRMESDRRWYDLVTARTLIQSLGRSIRNENDHAVSYILDRDWEKFYSRNRRLFPTSFHDALKMM